MSTSMHVLSSLDDVHTHGIDRKPPLSVHVPDLQSAVSSSTHSFITNLTHVK